MNRQRALLLVMVSLLCLFVLCTVARADDPAADQTQKVGDKLKQAVSGDPKAEGAEGLGVLGIVGVAAAWLLWGLTAALTIPVALIGVSMFTGGAVKMSLAKQRTMELFLGYGGLVLLSVVLRGILWLATGHGSWAGLVPVAPPFS